MSETAHAYNAQGHAHRRRVVKWAALLVAGGAFETYDDRQAKMKRLQEDAEELAAWEEGYSKEGIE